MDEREAVSELLDCINSSDHSDFRKRKYRSALNVLYDLSQLYENSQYVKVVNGVIVPPDED
jgi:hypothetical protein